MRKSISVLFLCLFLTIIFATSLRIQPSKANPSTLIVPDNYSTIQEAVDAAISGDTIFVKEGTYYENVVIDRKSNLTIIGENRKAVVDGNKAGAAFYILDSTWGDEEEPHTFGVKLAGFTIVNSSSGVCLQNTAEITITDNTITRCGKGVFFVNVYDHGSFSSRGSVLDSLIYDCGVGIYDGWIIRNNTIALNDLGIYLGMEIVDNNIEFNLIGTDTEWGHFVNNTFMNNFLCAVRFSYANWNHADHQHDYPDASFVGNNFVNNTSEVSLDMHVNPDLLTWDGGYPTGGNYWSSYEGFDLFGGPYQNLTGSDGIGDTPYNVLESSRDNYPLIDPISLSIPPLPSTPLAPRARFDNSPTTPVVNESIDFDAGWSKDLDGEVVTYTWDFDDGSGLVEAEKTTHFYNATGLYNVSLTVTDNDGLNGTVTSQVSVGKMPSEVSILADPAEITIRENTTISGAIVPTRPEANVTVWCRFETEDWYPLTTVTTDVNSEYEYVWTPSRTGFYALRASWDGDEFTLSNESAVIDFSCLNITSSIPIATSSASTYVGYRVNITGILQDMYGVPVSNETVVLYYTFSGISTWTPITSDRTDNSGGYSAMWIPPATGDFVIKAEWAGNATHSETKSIITLSALSYENQYVFSVESNSTISDLVFDTENSKLGFTATGPDGTSGYTRVTIAKTLFPDITDLKVRVDDVEYNYTVADMSESWVVTFTYNHSVHVVEIDLGTEPIPELTSPLVLLLFISTLLAVIIYKRKRIF